MNAMKNRLRFAGYFLVALLLLLLLLLQASVEGAMPPGRILPWDFATETKGINIWTRQVPGNPMKDFRVLMTADAPLDVVIGAIVGVNQAPR